MAERPSKSEIVEFERLMAMPHLARTEEEVERLLTVIDLVIGMLDVPAYERSANSLPHAVKVLKAAMAERVVAE